MKLSNLSFYYFNFIKSNYNDINHYSFHENTKKNLFNIFSNITFSFNKFSNLAFNYNSINYFFHKQIFSKKYIKYPKNFKSSFIHSSIISYIYKKSTHQTCFTFLCKGRLFHIYITLYPHSNSITLKILEKVVIFLYFLSHFTSNNCSRELSIYLFLTPHPKKLPNKLTPFDTIHVNSAFTFSCRPTSEIVIFRHQEWFKVLIHESFHSFGLDFSNLHETEILFTNSFLKEIFKVNIDFLLYESYSEFWAEVLNSMFFVIFDNPVLTLDYNKYIANVEKLISYNRVHCSIIMKQILSHNGFNYISLISNPINNEYKENTAIFAYFIIKNLLFIHFNETILYFQENNFLNILHFNNTPKNIKNFCNFIKKYYNSSQVLSFISKINDIYSTKYLQMDLYDFI